MTYAKQAEFEAALRNAGDDYTLVTSYRRAVVDVDGKMLPRERVTRRSILNKAGVVIFTQDFTVPVVRLIPPSVA